MAMLRLTSSTVVSNALRAISAPRILSAPITQVSLPFKRGIFPILSHHQQFSTDSTKPIDNKLVKILKSQIKSSKLSLGETIPAAPANFPFTIEYSSGGKIVTLKRELNEEIIEAQVTLPTHLADDESDVSDDDSESDSDVTSSYDSDEKKEKEEKEKESDAEEDSCCHGPVPHVHMIVTISKENGKKLELAVSAAARETIVTGISVMEAVAESNKKLMSFGPYFVDIESDLQIALREYLEVRGFDKSIGGFLYKYMVRKSKQDPMILLKKVKKFVRE